jgi:hypothetical protein
MEVLMDNVWIEKLAIQELCSRYCQTIDAQDSDGWAQCFAPDGAFEFDDHVVRGYAALREYAEAHTRAAGAAYDPNGLYDVDGDRAAGRATTVVSVSTSSGYKIMGQGAYHDDLVKVDGEWKIRHRRVVNDFLVSDPTKPVNLADPDVAALVQQLIDAANDQGSAEKKT